jgi:ABC-type transport system involved in multi-copper enzyme maturation permease subunit
VSLESIVLQVEQVVAGMAYWMGILLALFATAPLLSALLEPGRIDLMLAKPVSRWRLLLGHLTGVWLAIALLAIYLLGMVWLVMSVKSGIWNPRFLITIGLVVGMFAVMYSVVVLIGIGTQSTALALIVSYGLIFASIILAGREQLAPQINPPWRAVYIGFYHLLPNFAEVTGTVGRLATATAVTNWYPVVSSGLFGLALYAAAFILVARRDF